MNYSRLRTLYKKEIMDVLRDKKTILTMVVLPVILYPLLFVIIMQVVSFITTTQQEQTYHIAYEKVSDEEREALNDFIHSDKDGYDYVIKTLETDDAEADLKDEVIDAYLTLKEKDGQKIYEIHYLSAVTNSNTVSDMLKDEIEAYSKSVAEKNVKAQGLDVVSVLYPLDTKFMDHSSSESSIGSILGGILPFLMITAILMGAMYPAIDATAGEKERGTLETLLTLPINNMELIMSKFLSVATIAVVSVFINTLSMGAVAIYMYASIKALSEGMGTFKLSSFLPAAVVSLICVVAFALFMSALVMGVCAFAKSFKEANNYVTPVTLVVMLTGYIGFIPNVELTSKTALIPVANICLLMKNLLVFKYDFSNILLVMLSNVVYAFIAVWFLGKIYNSESILFGESASGIKLFERRQNIKKGGLPTMQEGLFVVVLALLLSIYIGGMVTMSHEVVGLLVTQAFIGVTPILVSIYTKGDLKKIFGIKLPKVKHLFGALVLYVGAGSLTMLLSNFLASKFPSDSQVLNESFMNILDGVPFVFGLLLIALTPAVCEEIMFRGYLLTAVSSKVSFVGSMLIVSFIFGLSHMSMIKLLPTMLLGCALYYARSKSGSIIASSIIHFLNNGVAVYMMYYGDKLDFLSDKGLNDKLPWIMLALGIVFTVVGVLLFRDHSAKEAEVSE